MSVALISSHHINYFVTLLPNFLVVTLLPNYLVIVLKTSIAHITYSQKSKAPNKECKYVHGESKD